MLQLGDKMTSVPSVEKNDVFVNRRGAHSHNIEIEGTGVDMRWLSKKLPGVIFSTTPESDLSCFPSKHVIDTREKLLRH